MQAFRTLAAVAVLSFSTAAYSTQSGGLTVSHFETLQNLNFVASGAAGNQKLSAAAGSVLKFDALGQTFELALNSNQHLLPAGARATLPSGVQLFRGNLAGRPDSWVRIVTVDGVPSGLIWDGQQLLAIEAPGDGVVATTEPVIYRLADTYMESGNLGCGVTMSGNNGDGMYKAMVGEIGAAIAQAPGAVSQIEFGAIGDFEFFNTIAGDPATAIATRLNNVDGIFSAQLGVQIVIQETEIFSDANDPFSDTTAPTTLLMELGTYRLNTPNQRSQGLTHLFTGRDLDGNTVGFAYGGTLCLAEFGAGLTEGLNGATTDSLVAAHEIGHNFGAPHDAEPGSNCENELPDFLMAPSINGSNQFSTCSISEMQPLIAAAFCITPLPGTDMTIALSGSAPAPLLGNSATINFSVTNLGTDPADNVAVSVALPGVVTFLSAAAPPGSCTSGAGTVDCLLGTVAGGGGSTVTISTISSAAGTGAFDASVSADLDDDPGNNQVSVPVTVIPAVELVIDPPAAIPGSVNGSGSISLTMENQSILDATGVNLTVNLGAGLQADSASWPLGNCSVSAQQVSCQAATFANQSSASLAMGFTATAEGALTYSVSLTAAETDSNPANNSANGVVNVNTPGGGGGGEEEDSGAGAVGLEVLLLLCLGLRRRRFP